MVYSRLTTNYTRLGNDVTWWRHQMEIFSALLALCARNSPVTSEFPSQKPLTRSFDAFFDLCLNKRLSKQSRRWWFETPSWLTKYEIINCPDIIDCWIDVDKISIWHFRVGSISNRHQSGAFAIWVIIVKARNSKWTLWVMDRSVSKLCHHLVSCHYPHKCWSFVNRIWWLYRSTLVDVI